uniref:Pr1-like protein n=1 Tax=Oryza sativa subsp. japonica TaxID=39947 RepID=Q6Z7M1_ORYSJ|nr:pr1-like protein [Oryza sativa Japonica Group]
MGFIVSAEGEGRADRVHGSGAHAAASRSTVDRVHPGSHRLAPWAPHVSRTRGRGRLTAGPHAAATRRARGRPCRRGRREAARPRSDGRRRRPPAQRSGGRERGGKGERRRPSTAHPGATAATGEVAGAEGGGGVARVDGDGGAPAVGYRNGEVDEVGEDAAKPKEAAPRWEAVRGDDGGGPELGGDGGERERRRELESGEEEGRREAETDGGGRPEGKETGAAFSGSINGAGGIRGGFPNESKGEREGKLGGKGEGITGNNSPLLIARGDDGMRRIRRRRRRLAWAERRERREVRDDG